MKVLHVITGLSQGGAEIALFRLVTHQNTKVKSVVISMTNLGVYGPLLKKSGIEVHILGMPRGKITIFGLIKLWKLIKNLRPDVVQTWMYHSDLIGGIISRLVGIKAIAWGLHNFNLNSDGASFSTRVTAKLCAALSGIIPASIISCSERAVSAHINVGYKENKFTVIPLGYNLSIYNENQFKRNQIREKWGFSQENIVLGCVARWDPQKDHRNLLSAIELLRVQYPLVKLVLAGPRIDKNNDELVTLIKHTNLDEEYIVLEGPVGDVPSVMTAFDIHILSSMGEAFPNVVAEAMACCTPCVVTDVGDAAAIVGNTGWVAPPKNHVLLAEVIEKAIQEVRQTEKWQLRRRASRDRIVRNYSMCRMVESYEKEWRIICSNTI
jgi:glycosyltransferase involved in cell wall biosynthesis